MSSGSRRKPGTASSSSACACAAPRAMFDMRSNNVPLSRASFGVSSLVGGLASSQELLIAARAGQGVGGALLVPATLSLIATEYEEGAARNRLESAGFDVNVEEDAETPAKPGQVLSQDPSPGSRQPQGTTVTITVSRYEKPTEEPTPTEEPSPTDLPVPTETPTTPPPQSDEE